MWCKLYNVTPAFDLRLYQTETPTQVFVFLRNLRNILEHFFEEHLRTTAFSSSSFKLDLVDLTVFPDSNLRLAKINKPLTTVCVSKFSRFCSHTCSFLRYQTQILQNLVCFFIHFQ